MKNFDGIKHLLVNKPTLNRILKKYTKKSDLLSYRRYFDKNFVPKDTLEKSVSDLILFIDETRNEIMDKINQLIKEMQSINEGFKNTKYQHEIKLSSHESRIVKLETSDLRN